MVSCGREVTSPGSGARYVQGLSWNAIFPTAFQALGAPGSSLVQFNRVRIVIHHSDGSVALDTVVAFPSGSGPVTLNFTVLLLAGAPAAGEQMTVTLYYLDTGGTAVFTGGPVPVTFVPGSNPTLNIPVVYTGPGANAAAVAISPRTQNVFTGAGFQFTAAANDHGGLPVANAPIFWTSLDPTIATLTSATAGAGLALNGRGTARIVAQLVTGQADTVRLTVLLPATALTAQSGNGQTAFAGAALAQPIVAKVAASDGIGVAGVTVTFAVATGGGAIGNTSVVSDANGLAQTSWTLGAGPGSQSVTASSGTLTNSPVTFTALAQAAGASKLVFTTQPADGTAGAALAPVRVTVEDADGNVATTYTGPVTLALGANPGGSTLGGTLTVSAVGGVATFSTLTLNKAAGGYTLTATTDPLTPVASNTFNIVAGTLTRLMVTTQPANGTAGAVLAQVRVAATDAGGNVVTTFTDPVTLALGANPGGSTLGGTLTVSAVGGVATFSTLSLDKAANGYTLTASSGALTPVTSNTFNIIVGAATQLVVTTQPVNGTAGLTLAAVRISAEDAAGNVRTTFSGPVTLAFGANPSGAALGGSLTATAVAGIATFSTLTVSKAGTGYTLTASSAGLTGVTTTPFDIGAAPAALVFTGQPSTTTAGSAFSPPVVVTVEDGQGSAMSTFGGPVTLALGTNPTGASLGGTVTVNAVAGVATFPNVFVPLAGTGYTLVATVGGTLPVSSTAFDITAGAATQLVVTAQPANGSVISPLAPVGIAAADDFGNVVTSFTGQVTVAFGANPSSASLGGTLTVNAVAGVATFSTLTVSTIGTGYTLAATSAGLKGVTTAPFNITATPAAYSIAINGGDNQSGKVSTTLSTALSVIVLDASNNPVSGYTVTFAVLTGGGSVTPSTAVTNASGIASTSWTLGPTSGTQTASATATGVIGSPLTFTATAKKSDDKH